MGVISRKNGKRYIVIHGLTFQVDAGYCLQLLDELLEEEPHLHREVVETKPSKTTDFTLLRSMSDKHYL